MKMNIKKLNVFASDVDAPKSTAGLELERGFPKGIKPARDWFNYLFNATTSKINELIEDVNILTAREHYKVGDIYLTTQNHTPESVAEQQGYGTWQLYAQGKALIGLSQSSSDPEWTKQIGNVFGEYDHTLTEEEIPEHNHSEFPFDKFISRSADSQKGTRDGSDYSKMESEYGDGDMAPEDWEKATESSVGGSQAHNNTQPSIVIQVWKRVT